MNDSPREVVAQKSARAPLHFPIHPRSPRQYLLAALRFMLVLPPCAIPSRPLVPRQDPDMLQPTSFARLHCERLEDRCQPSASSLPMNLTPVGDELYFVANDGVHGHGCLSPTARSGHPPRARYPPGIADSDSAFSRPSAIGSSSPPTTASTGSNSEDRRHGGRHSMVKDINRGKDGSFPGSWP